MLILYSKINFYTYIYKNKNYNYKLLKFLHDLVKFVPFNFNFIG